MKLGENIEIDCLEGEQWSQFIDIDELGIAIGYS